MKKVLFAISAIILVAIGSAFIKVTPQEVTYTVCKKICGDRHCINYVYQEAQITAADTQYYYSHGWGHGACPTN